MGCHQPLLQQPQHAWATAHSRPAVHAHAAAARLQQRHRRTFSLLPAVARQPDAGGGDDLLSHLGALADKYLLGQHSKPGASSSRRGRAPQVQQQQRPPLQAIHVLLACLVLVWLAGTAGLLPPAQLVLDPSRARWTSLLTDAFACTSSQLLARNAFLVYVFGRVVQNTEGGAAVWCVFLLSALGGGASVWLFLPKRACAAGCASTAALFGLFAAAAVLNRHKQWHWHRFFELAMLLPFMLQQLLGGHPALAGMRLGPLQLPAAWVPLLGGLAGSAAAAGLLALARAVAVATAKQQKQQQGSGTQGPPGEVPVPELLARALAQVLRRSLKGGSP